MSQVRHRTMMIQNERILREENSRLQASLDEAKKYETEAKEARRYEAEAKEAKKLAETVAEEAKKYEAEAKEAKKLAETVAEEHKMAIANVKGSLIAVQKELEKEKSETETVKGSANKLRQELDAAKKAEKDLEAKVEELEAKNKLVLDNLAKVEAETSEKIAAGKDYLVDLAMYRVWEHNQDINISFLGDEAEGLLKKWKARLEEELELCSISASEAISEDDNDHEVISSALKTGSSRSEEIVREVREAFAAEDQTTVESEPAALSNEPPAAEDASAARP